MLADTATLLCAVSGGADSVCLLHILKGLAPELGFTLHAAHYHHGIRGGEADRDRDFVRELCRQWDIPLHTGAGDVPAHAASRGVGLETAARELRYAFLEDTASHLEKCRIATAHQAEDNAETLLMHLCRGTGLQGLCGIPPVRGRIVRPLLVLDRPEVLAYLSARQIPHMEDSTNALEDQVRNRLRHSVLPVLRELNPRFPAAALRASLLLRQDEACLRRLAEESFTVTGEWDVRFSAASLAAMPEPLAARALRMGAERLDCRPEREHIAELLRLASAAPGRKGCDLPGGVRAVREFDALRLTRQGERPALPETKLRFGLWQDPPGLGCRVYWGPPLPDKVHEKFPIFFFKNANICGSISVRSRRSGDRLRALGTGTEKTLKKWMIERKIPASRRADWPVFADERGIVAVPGLGTAERVGAPPERADAVLILSERNGYAENQVR